MLDFSFVHTHAGCGVGLRVKVAEQNFHAQIMEGGCQIYGTGGFTHTAFLIDHCNYFAHFSSFFSMVGFAGRAYESADGAG